MFRLVALVIAMAVGLASRRHPLGVYFWDKTTGDLCYGAAAYLVAALLLPAVPPRTDVAIAAFYCVAIECFKLTGLPLSWQANPALRVVFGSVSSWRNLAAYLDAIAAMFLLEVVLFPQKSVAARDTH